MSDHVTLLTILNRCRELTLVSEESFWAGAAPTEIVAELDRAIEAIEAIEQQKYYDTSKLKLLFGPTCSIQDTAIDNGWGDEYIEMSMCFDQLIDKIIRAPS